LNAECGLTTYTLRILAEFELKLKVIKFFERAATGPLPVLLYTYEYICIGAFS